MNLLEKVKNVISFSYNHCIFYFYKWKCKIIFKNKVSASVEDSCFFKNNIYYLQSMDLSSRNRILQNATLFGGVFFSVLSEESCVFSAVLR